MSLTHPKSPLRDCDEVIRVIPAALSPTGLPVELTESGAHRLALAAMQALRDSDPVAAILGLALAWERAINHGELGGLPEQEGSPQ